MVAKQTVTSDISLDACGSDAAAVLGNPQFIPVDYAVRYQDLSAKLQLDFSNILFAFAHIPLTLSGSAHRACRASMARRIQPSQKHLAPIIPELVRAHFDPIATPGDVDVMQDCVHPFVNAVMTQMSGVPTHLDLSLVSRIFSANMGVAKRRRLEAQLSAARAELERLYPDEGPDDLGERLALVVLGKDALLGTLARTLHHHFDRAKGKPLCEADLARGPTRTGVPFIDRQAISETAVGANRCHTGDVVRCHLETLEKENDFGHERFFGKGEHLCLGRRISLVIFQEMAEFLGTLPVRIETKEFELRKDDVFRLPETFVVRVSNG